MTAVEEFRGGRGRRWTGGGGGGRRWTGGRRHRNHYYGGGGSYIPTYSPYDMYPLYDWRTFYGYPWYAFIDDDDDDDLTINLIETNQNGSTAGNPLGSTAGNPVAGSINIWPLLAIALLCIIVFMLYRRR